MESFTSRESGFLFNNLVFVVMCFAVLWGTLFPVISEAVRGTKITVGPPFFNQINVPIGLILLALTGIGPLLAWRNTSKESLIKNFTFPILSGLIAAALFMVIGFKGSVIISFSLSVFVLATITTEFKRGIRARTKKFSESIFKALFTMISKNRSRYGGYIVHVGIVFMFVGFTGHAFDKEKEFSLKIGETDHVAGYEFTLLQMSEAERPNHYAWISDIRVTNNKGEYVTNLYPEKRIYFHKNPDVNRRQPHSELDIYSTLNQDIYSIFSAVDNENGVAFLKIMVNPLVRWVWIGGYILVIGTVIAMWPRKD
jgi:cytochrome c-type biogenesis protein CcmF